MQQGTWKSTLLLVLLITASKTAVAKRRIVPSDDKVIIKIKPNAQKIIADKKKLDPRQIDILVWNMYKGRMDDWAGEYPELIKDFDVLLMQELWLDKHMGGVFNKDEKFTYYMATSFIDTKENNTPSGVGTASYVEPMNVTFQRSHYLEPFIKTPKMVLFTEYPLEGMEETLLTVNIHAINFTSVKKFEHQVAAMMTTIINHRGPVVLGGDFNTWRKKRYKLLTEYIQSAGLTEVQFPNGEERMQVMGKVLDYIFVRGVDVLDSYVYGKSEASDHKAMRVRLSVDNSQ